MINTLDHKRLNFLDRLTTHSEIKRAKNSTNSRGKYMLGIMLFFSVDGSTLKIITSTTIHNQILVIARGPRADIFLCRCIALSRFCFILMQYTIIYDWT